MTVSTHTLKSELDRIVDFIKPLLHFANCHMVNYLSENYWEHYIPEEIRQETDKAPSIQTVINNFWIDNDSNSSLKNFITHSRSFCLRDPFYVTRTQLINNWKAQDKITTAECVGLSLHITEFMSQKKCHEVEITAELINILRLLHQNNVYNNFVVIDAGDGKGYLSSRLALEFNIHVLGIDANIINTSAARKRNNKLQRAWNALKSKAIVEQTSNVSPMMMMMGEQQQTSFVNNVTNNYQVHNLFINATTDFRALIAQHFPRLATGTGGITNTDICLVGLHTCGNLASNCLKIFCDNQQVKRLCNVGCCYHLLDETFATEDFFTSGAREESTDKEYPGFPLSAHLKAQSFGMGRNARNLAQQSVDRGMALNEAPNKTIFYRALLEVYLIELGHKNKPVGRVKKCIDFQDYAKKVLNEMKMNLHVDESELKHRLSELESEYAKHESLLHLFYLIRMTLAPVLETIILLDRLLYLRENDMENSYLVRLYDPIVSPRCFGLVAIK